MGDRETARAHLNNALQIIGGMVDTVAPDSFIQGSDYSEYIEDLGRVRARILLAIGQIDQGRYL